jgi:hypothetical protein
MDCPVCYYSFDIKVKIPKILTKCGHTLCLTCLDRLCQDGTIHCPFCKEIYIDQNSNITSANFPNNFYILNVLEDKK